MLPFTKQWVGMRGQDRDLGISYAALSVVDAKKTRCVVCVAVRRERVNALATSRE